MFQVDPEVKAFRSAMNMEADLALLSLDSWGLKKTFTHLVRRFLAGSEKPRDARQLLAALLVQLVVSY